jgi:serine/threonine protein kinase
MPKLADFGIAHSDVTRTTPATSDEDLDENTQSLSTVTLFSPRWAAPEQLCGAPEGPYTDVYAFALVAAYMLRAKIPFSDGNVRNTFADRVQSDDFVSERLVWLGFEGDLREVLFSALRANAAQRTQSAPEFFDAIRRVLRGSVVVSAIAANKIAPEDDGDPFHPTPQRGLPAISLNEEAPTLNLPPPDQRRNAMVPAPGPAPVQPAFSPFESLRVELPDAPHREVPEKVSSHGARNVRYITVHEKLDLSFLDANGGEVRFRVSILPTQDSLNLKGLNCFVCRTGGRPSPAMTATADGTADLVSARRETLGSISWSFGVPGPTGRVFLVDGAQLVVPYGDAAQAVALLPSRGRDLVVMLRR